MCGFAGFLSASELTNPNEVLNNMGISLQHRGPDSQGIWLSESNLLGLVHRRLAIQDLSPLGHQPMHSRSKRFIIAFNGEIYNFQTISAELSKLGWCFQGHSDTEVMLAAFEQWGIEQALAMFSGMFSFALVDTKENVIHFARDRMGEKPLYYYCDGQTWLFASELKALHQFPNWQAKINRDALPLLLRHNFIPAPHTIYQNTYKLMPSTLLSVSLNSGQLISNKKYWHLDHLFSEELSLSFSQASDELEQKLIEVIEEQMISDAPLGAFLSGGVDSSTVVAIMQSLSEKKVNTFSIGFNDPKFNEAIHARAVAKHIGTEHQELYFSAKEGLDLIPNLSQYYDEPFADSSQLATFILCQMTKQKVTVALSGDGGDELFCGYTRYFEYLNKWQHQQSIKGVAQKALLNMPERFTLQLLKHIKPNYRKWSNQTILEKIERERVLLNTEQLQSFYQDAVSYWVKPETLVIDGKEPKYSLNTPLPNCIKDPYKQMMYSDLNWYLPDDILVKVDRASMANSLETRVPLLDKRIVEYALKLPTTLNIKNEQGKQVLRSVLYKYVPKNLIERPKAGFAVPVADWLRTDLKDWAEELLEPAKLEQQGYWNTVFITHKWQEHKAGNHDHSFQLWGVLMFQQWLKEAPHLL